MLPEMQLRNSLLNFVVELVAIGSVELISVAINHVHERSLVNSAKQMNKFTELKLNGCHRFTHCQLRWINPF